MSLIRVFPTTRVSDIFVRQQLTNQLHADQLDIFRLQAQISTGRRILVPSDDAAAALRSVGLQRILERKDQLQSNLGQGNSYLAAADNALSGVSGVLSDLRGAVVGIVDTVATDEQRQAIVEQIDFAMQQLLNTSNSSFRGRLLFSGSRSLQSPYADVNGFVEHRGNEDNLRSFMDLGYLFETNVPGTDVFGGISAQVVGSVDLNPHLTENTLLSSINQGQGISPHGAISISAQIGGTTTTSVVDLSRAATLGDVARLIENGAPSGADITVEIGGEGLNVRLTDPTGTLFINEAADGTTARELGVYTGNSAPPSPHEVIGADLDPVVLNTTRLDQLLGSKAQARVISSGANNDFLLTAKENGDATSNNFNGVDVILQNGALPGGESVVYDDLGVPPTLTITIADGFTTAQDIVDLVNADGALPFAAQVDLSDATTAIQAGSAPVSAGITVTTAGGSGSTLDTASGLIVTNGGSSAVIDLSEAETVEDLLNLLNGAGLGLHAEINASRDGINIRSRWSGADLTIGENGGTTATQLGIRSYTAGTQLAGFNRGVGVETGDGADLAITAADGTSFDIDLSGATTVQDVLDAINTAPANAGLVTAQLAPTGNGIQLVDTSGGAGDLIVASVFGSQAAEMLGLVPPGQTSVSSPAGVIQSEDRHTLEVDSVFNTLARLRTAVEQNDSEAMGRALERLGADLDRVNEARAEVGIRQQTLDILRVSLEDEEVHMRATLSENLDVDFVEAVSNLTARQLSMQASLQTTAGILSLSLLDFI